MSENTRSWIKEFGNGIGIVVGVLLVIFYLSVFSSSKVNKAEFDIVIQNMDKRAQERHNEITDDLFRIENKVEKLDDKFDKHTSKDGK